MQISVVIPSFNRKHTLPRALDSVIAQTVPAREIVVVDDGSSDGTEELLARRYPRVTCVRQENLGVSAARNKGIRTAKSEWIALLDSDDCWHPEKLQRQRDAIEHTAENYYLCHNDEIWIRNGRRVNPKHRHVKHGGRVYQKCLPLCSISPSAVLIHRRVFESVGWFDEHLPACEDYDFWLRVCARFPVLFVREALTIKYGGHDDQLSRRYWGMDRFRIIALERAVGDPQLSANDLQATLQALVTKLDILQNGARKRGKRQWANELALKRAHYANRLENLTQELEAI